MDSQETVCSPILSVEELENFKIPSWTNSILPLQSKNNWCISTNNIQCHEDIQKWKVQPRYLSNTVPRTIVCHDMKGGYLEDRFIHGSKDESSYNFIHWMVIDTFIYFSHSFITIPPFGWINAAHRHGVYILGTIITEGKSGEELLNSIINNDDKINMFVNAIVNLTECFKLDGWLLNIENQVKNVIGLKKLVKQLTNELHHQNPRTLIIWYDSVLETGELKWQNELNEKNSCWFDMCDGIFLNYNWKDKHLLDTYNNCGNRNLDVYVGIDVFARNCLGGMHSHKSMKLIREHGFSAAIFAPGWTHESLTNEPNDTFRKRFEVNDLKFWKSLSPYLYEHGTKNLFKTIFHSGCSKNYYNMNSLDLKMNSLRLGIDVEISNVINNIDQKQKENNNKDINNCNCQTIVDTNMLRNGTALKICYQKPHQINRIVTCDVTFDNTLLVACIYQYVQTPIKFNILLLCQNANGRLSRTELELQSDDVANSNYMNCVLSQYEKLILLRRIFQLHTPLDDKWILKCFKIKNRDSKIIELGVELIEAGEILIGGLAICTYPIRGGMQ